jgi:hypothetical protein
MKGKKQPEGVIMKAHQQWANEQEAHQEFILSQSDFPKELKAQPDIETLVWASELRIHDAGRYGGDGSADLLTVDECGQAWIVEVKLWGSSELNADIWHQLRRYREGLAAMEWDDIHCYVDRFLLGEGVLHPFCRFKDCRDLVDVIRCWQERIGRSLHTPEEIRNRIAHALKHRLAGLAVLSDGPLDEVIRGARDLEHRGPVACIRAFPSDHGMQMDVCWHRLAEEPLGTSLAIPTAHQKAFEKYRADVQQTCTPQSLPLTICTESADLWNNHVAPGFKQMGWDGRDSKNHPRGVVVAFPVAGQRWPMIHAGWSITDAKATRREHKKIGSAGLRLDVDLKFADQLLAPDQARAFVEHWGTLLYNAGWRGRMHGKNLGIRPLKDSEYETWTKIMTYKPSETVTDFIGRPDEPGVIANLLKILAGMIQALEDAPPQATVAALHHSASARRRHVKTIKRNEERIREMRSALQAQFRSKHSRLQELFFDLFDWLSSYHLTPEQRNNRQNKPGETINFKYPVSTGQRMICSLQFSHTSSDFISFRWAKASTRELGVLEEVQQALFEDLEPILRGPIPEDIFSNRDTKTELKNFLGPNDAAISRDIIQIFDPILKKICSPE